MTTDLNKIRCEYKLFLRFGAWEHQWSVKDDEFGIHLHITDYRESDNATMKKLEPSGGLEIHYRTPPEGMKGQAPSQDDCWLLRTPCWHDGSSLSAAEFFDVWDQSDVAAFAEAERWLCDE